MEHEVYTLRTGRDIGGRTIKTGRGNKGNRKFSRDLDGIKFL